MNPLAVTVDEMGWAAVALALAGLCVRLIRGAASKRESPQERASRLMMAAITELADRFDTFAKEYGTGCMWRDGQIPDHVIRWAQQIVTQSENDRLKRGRS